MINNNQPSVYEQYMLELINRARTNPDAEAERYDLDDLNRGFSPGTITNSAKQPLAFNFSLIDAARDHSQWISDTNTFDHTGAGGSSPGQRMAAAGYDFTGSWSWGENIAWQGTTGTPNITSFVASEHRGLFLSDGHRRNILNGNFREIGVGVVQDTFATSTRTYNAVISTQKFAYSGNSVFLTGVAFDDLVVDDSFYTIGEGLTGIEIKATRQSDNQVFTTETMNAGGYQIALGAGTYDVTFSDNGSQIGESYTITIGSYNVKLDLDTSAVNNRIFGSNDKDTIDGGAGNDSLYGRGNNDRLLGGDDNDSLYGGSGNDKLFGGNDDDRLVGANGNDSLYGDDGADKLFGGNDDDRLVGGSGNDSLYGGNGTNQLFGQNDNDKLFGGNDKDSLYGGSGDDRLFGRNDNDLLVGSSGNDFLNGGLGLDSLRGGGGSDRFLLVSATTGDRDIIEDFQNSSDLLVLSGNLSFGNLDIFDDPAIASTVIEDNRTNAVIAVLSGIDSSLITEADFR